MTYDEIDRLVEVVNGMNVGKRKAIVLSNQSTDNPGWLELQPIEQDAAQSSNTFWAEPCVPLAGPAAHSYFIPDEGAIVWYENVGGHPDHFVWTGCTWGQESGLAEADLNPSIQLLRAGDVQVALDAQSGTLTLKSGDKTCVTLSADTVRIEAATIELIANGKQVSLSAAGFDALSGALKVV